MAEVMIRTLIKGCMTEYIKRIADLERRIEKLEGKNTLQKNKQTSSVLNYKGDTKFKRGFTSIGKEEQLTSMKSQNYMKNEEGRSSMNPLKTRIDVDTYLSPVRLPTEKVEMLLKNEEVPHSVEESYFAGSKRLQKLPIARKNSNVKPMKVKSGEALSSKQINLSPEDAGDIEEEKVFSELKSPPEKPTELVNIEPKRSATNIPIEKEEIMISNKPKILEGSKNRFDGSSASDSDPDTFHCQCAYDNRTETVSNAFLELKQSKEPCSKFCKYLSPEEEQRVILKATDSIDEFSHSGGTEDDKYAVPAKWWRSWCKYIDVSPKSLENLKLKVHKGLKSPRKMTQKLGEDDDFEIIDFDESPPKYSQTRKAFHRSSSLSSPNQDEENPRTSRSTKRNLISFEVLKYKPGKIFNHNLVYFDNNSNLKLKDDLVEEKDYYLVDSKTWNYFLKWYGCDMEARFREPYESEGESADNSQDSGENEGESDSNEEDSGRNSSDSQSPFRHQDSDDNEESISGSNSNTS
ncbi:unnamed protein product [Moneuplotes crassus]|uniref:DUSP domain-containing protein n=1 Tax=Euplotes crassus TaxID=5936 RepID=A0AAD1X2N3_EUPCR|nr:unnamed protein product [Moneuplotes crassus]